MSDISKEVLETIEKEKITPKSKLHFYIKNYVIWISLLIILILSSLAVTVILFISTTNDWDVLDYLDKSLLESILVYIPYFWLIVFGLLILGAYYMFAKTKHGYRYAVFNIFWVSIVVGSALGIALFLLGVDSEIQESLSKRVPFYNYLVYYKEDIWDNPKKGLLGGEITDVISKNEFVIKDFKGNTWHIILDNITLPDEAVLKNGLEIKLLGNCDCSNNIFYVRSIHQW